MKKNPKNYPSLCNNAAEKWFEVFYLPDILLLNPKGVLSQYLRFDAGISDTPRPE